MKKFEYRVYENAKVTEGMAQLLNRNYFYVAKHKKVTEEELGEIQKKRGTAFSVAAFDEDVCIGMVAAYFSSGQNVAKSHQIYIGTMLIDKFYLYRPTVIVALFKRAIDEVRSRNLKEILSETSKSNKLSFDMLKRHGFVLLDDKLDYYGYYTLHNFLPVVFDFFGRGSLNDEIVHQTNYKYHFLPKVNRTERDKVSHFISDNVILQEFNLSFGKIVLYVNIEFAVVLGFEIFNQYSFLPLGQGRYLLNNNLDELLNFKICQEDTTMVLNLSPEDQKEINIQEDKDFFIEVLSRKFYFFTSRIQRTDIISLENKIYENENYYCILNRSTGLLSVFSKSTHELLIKVLWHCAKMPYVEGAFLGKSKSLLVDSNENEIIISEDGADFKIISHYLFSEQRIQMNTEINFMEEGEKREERNPFGQIWTDGTSDLFQKRPDFADFVFWVEDSKYLVNHLNLRFHTTLAQIESNAILLANLPTIGIDYGDLQKIETNIWFTPC